MKLRLEASVVVSATLLRLSLTSPYDMPFSLHESMQLKQLTHLLTSTCLLRKSMQEDLHDMAHLPQRVHLASSNLILKRESLAQQPEKGSHRANGVAIEPAVPECKEPDEQKE